MTPRSEDELSSPEAPSQRSRSSRAAAIWFLFVGPGAVFYAVWVAVIERHFFSRWLVLPFVVLYLAYAAWTYRLGKEHLTLRQTRRQWVVRLVLLVVFVGPLLILYAPALLLAGTMSAALDVAWTRLRPPSPLRKSMVSLMCTVLAFALLFPLANRLYVIHGAFYTLFAPEPPRLMPNPLFDVDDRGLRGPDDPAEHSDAHRILLLGDSVSWGFPYSWEDTYARHLGERLEEEGWEVEILNAAIPSQSVVQIQARLPELLDYEPKAAILMIGYQWTRAVEHRERLDASRWLRWSPRTEWVFLPPFVPEILHLGPRSILRGLTGTTKRWQDADANREQFRVALEQTAIELRRAGVRVLFVGHPALKLDERIDALIRQEASRSGSRYVDARALFSSEGEYAFGDEVHPNEAGHRRVADLLVQPVREMLSSQSRGGTGR